MTSVYVTGIGVVSAIGCDRELFWDRLLAGASGVGRITSFDTEGLSTRIGAEARAFEPEAFLDPKSVSRTSRASQMAIGAARQALEHASLDDDGENTAACVACSQGGFVSSEPYFGDFFMRRRSSPFAIVKPMNSAPASHVSIACGLRGPVFAVDSACSSANHAIGLAAMMIATGVVDRAVAGGTDTVFSPGVFRSWCALNALSRSNDDPARACKPFNRLRDGTVLGEGAGMLVLESAASVRDRGARPLAELIGYGCSADAHHITRPTVDGQAAALRRALATARVAPADVDYVNAHATGTPDNDAVETAALRQALGRRAYEVPISGIKPAVGHTLAASAAIECISCVLTLVTGQVPQTLNTDPIDPACDLDYVTGGPRAVDAEICVSQSFGFGGSNAVVVLRRAGA